ncbi:hypothetical protein [Salinibacterium sp. M195]|uniref:hypothetical protein n=1 Tax=Salinibacterium sp. M195 TaxID=2583374 RepID=UPI001C634CF9|nr:hypothetical protein [Salinibacterium sp. M195]
MNHVTAWWLQNFPGRAASALIVILAADLSTAAPTVRWQCALDQSSTLGADPR